MTEDVRSPLQPSLIGTVLSGRYKLDSKLGSGGMSTVYLARDETLERWVAVKLMHREMSDQPDQLERFRREARSVAQVSHPNVVSVIDAGEDGGYPYIVFEYVQGETLKQRIDRLGRLPLDEAAAYAIEVGRGLAAAHTNKLVHRDVKPQNVLIDPEGRAKVTDFGIARELESDGLTKTGRVLGTTDYVSPEQAMGQGVDARSDIYSLGVLLYEMLTGRVPFEADSLVGVAMKHVNEPMPDLQELRPDASSALAAVIERATLKDPKKRYADMNAMLAELEGALEVEVSRSGTAHGQATNVLDSVGDRRRLLPSRRASLAGIVLVLAATGVALLIAGISGKKDHETSAGGSAPSSGSEISLKEAAAFDPIAGDGENDDLAPQAVDADPKTAWPTSTYTTSPTLAEDGKDGVGLIVDAGKPVAARSIEITSVAHGWEATVYAADGSTPPDTAPPTGWKPVSSKISDLPTDATIQLNDTSSARFYLIWITKLSPEATQSPEGGSFGGYNVQIEDVKLFS
jgi:eukaryotic-like serine/threonine-protein kinase